MSKAIWIVGAVVVLVALVAVAVFVLGKGGFDDGDVEEIGSAVIEEAGLTDVEDRYDTHFGFLGIAHDTSVIELGVVWDRPHPGPFNANEIGYADYDWDEADEYVDKVQAGGIVTLATIWPFEQADQQSCHGSKARAQGQFGEFPDWLYLPCDMSAYADFVSALVERYDGDGVDDYAKLQYPIRYWEVSNEPEMQNDELTFFQGKPAEYAELLRVTSEAVRAADSSAVVVQGGAAGLNAFESEDFWRDVFAVDGAGEWFDVANVHSLSGSVDLFVEDWKTILADYGMDDKPIWVTEAQFGSKIHEPPTDPSTWGDSPPPPTTTSKTQEELVRDGVLMAFAHGADKIFWTTYQAPPSFKLGNDSLAEEMNDVAFVNSDGTPRDSHTWFVEYVGKLNQFTTVRSDNDQLIFTTPTGEVTYANPE